MKIKFLLLGLILFLAVSCQNNVSSNNKPINPSVVLNNQPSLIVTVTPTAIPTAPVKSVNNRVDIINPNRAALKQPEPTEDELAIKINQKIDGETIQTLSIKDGSTALDLLKMSHDLKTKNYGSLGELIIGIDGRMADGQNFWEFFINNKSSNVGASSYTLKNGDVIEWRFSKIN